jgi:hypothetical protein
VGAHPHNPVTRHTKTGVPVADPLPLISLVIAAISASYQSC